LRIAFKGKPPLADFDSDLSDAGDDDDDDDDDEDDDDTELDDTGETEDEVDIVIGGNHRAKENHSNGDLDVDVRSSYSTT